jgi:hypothetical protein
VTFVFISGYYDIVKCFMEVIWVVTSCERVGRYRRFVGTYILQRHFHRRDNLKSHIVIHFSPVKEVMSTLSFHGQSSVVVQE